MFSLDVVSGVSLIASQKSTVVMIMMMRENFEVRAYFERQMNHSRPFAIKVTQNHLFSFNSIE